MPAMMVFADRQVARNSSCKGYLLRLLPCAASDVTILTTPSPAPAPPTIVIAIPSLLRCGGSLAPAVTSMCASQAEEVLSLHPDAYDLYDTHGKVVG